MNQKYSDEIDSLIVKTVLAYSDKISQVDHCKAYKIGLGEEVTIDLYNNVQYVIGAGKYIFQSWKNDCIQSFYDADYYGRYKSWTHLVLRKRKASKENGTAVKTK